MNEAQAKTVQKEAVEAVVNSFAKHTHGHGGVVGAGALPSEASDSACVVESALLATAWQAVLIHPLSKV
ncbi:hypothetical protein ACOMHN_027218 [Nucella lapillus]